MLSTAIGVQFNVNDLDANYEVVGTSDNYSFQYNLGKGSDIASFEGEAIQKIVSLEGNYGEFDVRVFASSDIGVRSAFVESGILISPPRFEETFTFADLRIENIPDDASIGSINLYEPQYPGDKLEVESEYINRNVKISWSLIPPVGHAKEGQPVTAELLSDSFFEKFSITLENGEEGQVIDNQVLAGSIGMQDTLSTADVTGLLDEYRDFSITLNENCFEELNLDRSIGIKIISHDSFGRTSTGILTGINYEPQVEGLSYALRGSDMSFSWFSNDTDFSGVSIQSLAIPSDKSLIYPQDIQSSLEFYQELDSAENWNFGRSEYRSGDMALYGEDVYRAKTNINQSLIASLGRDSVSPLNSGLWENVGKKIEYKFDQVDTFEESYSSYQVWGYSYYYSFQAIDGYGRSNVYNLTEFGLALNRDLRAFTSEVKIGALRYREQKDDLIFNWDVVDQDGVLVDLDKYRFALTNSDIPSLLGLSGSLFDSETKEFLTGITEGNTSKISTVDEFGNRQVIYDLPNTEVFNTYEFTREINNQIYGTGGFLTNYEIFDASKVYSSGENVADSNKNIFTALQDTDYVSGDPYIRPFYSLWEPSGSYAQGEVVEYAGDLYKVNQEFGPQSNQVVGVFDTGVNYNSGDLVIYTDADIHPYFTDQEYLAGDIVLFNQTFYLALRDQVSGANYFPDQYKIYWQNISIFENLNPVIYKAIDSINASIENPYTNVNVWQPQRPNSSEYFSKHISGFSLNCDPWSDSLSYNSGNLVLYEDDIWRSKQDSGPLYDDIQKPSGSSVYWSNLNTEGQDIVPAYDQGDLIYYSGMVYQCLSSNPGASPIPAVLNFGDTILSSYSGTDWLPFWEQNHLYDGFVYGHAGIPESGKRSVGLEVGIVDNQGKVLNSRKIIGINQEPSIIPQGFQVDSLSETTKVKFNFNYAFSSQEKTTKVNLYRSNEPTFSITGVDGLPYQSTGEGSTLVKITLGAADATFGENITQIVDSPPIPKIDNIDQITGYYYKILPFDDFGSGDLYAVSDNQGTLERCLVYPKNYSNKNPNGLPGPVYRTSQDDIPGTVANLTGNVAFENFFLSWQHPSGNIINPDDIPNDLSHYEVWVSDEDKLELGSLGSELYLKSQADPLEDVDFSNDLGFRRIETDISSTGPIPIELQDPASGITNATKAFNIPANGNEVETSYFGKTNETKYFWVRTVDFAGNKGPFTGEANLNSNVIKGLKLTLGQASATDIDDFELNMTETFGNTIALAPDADPFFDQDGSYVSWPDHVLYHHGTGYLINGSGIGPNYDVTSASYIWWDNNDSYQATDPDVQFNNLGLRNVFYENVNYKVSSSHPAGGSSPDGNYINADSDFNEGDFIVSRIVGFPSLAKATPVYNAFSNALIGTANIAEAAIIDAKINNLKADKITAGEIKGHEIVVGSNQDQYGSIASPGFKGFTNPNDGTTYDQADKGFVISGDGTFEFRSDQGKLALDADGTVSLEGRLRQSDGTPYDFIDLSCSPAFFNYNEIEDPNDIDSSIIELADSQNAQVVASFRNSSIEDDQVLFRMSTVSNVSGLVNVFDYNDWINRSNYEISGLRYDHSIVENFEIDGAIRHAKATFDPQGFDDIVSYYGADSVILYCSGLNNNYETSTTISRVIDGLKGAVGASATYQGDWQDHDSTKTYFASRERSDIVRYNNNYYIAAQTHVRGNVFELSNWKDFGATFSSVATSILLTEQGYITDTLTIGDTNSGGKIISNGFVGGFNASGNHLGETNEDYDPEGFRMERTDGASPAAIFDIGGIGPNNTPSYIRFSSETQKVEIRGGFTNNSTDENVNFSDITSLDPQAVFIGGGYNNNILKTSTSDNFNSLGSSIVGGANNQIEARFSFIGNGYDNECNDNFSAIVGGYNNAMVKISNLNEGANFIGAGQNNTINGGTNQSIIGGTNNTIIG